MGNLNLRTLKDYIDSGQSFEGVFFRSRVQITGGGARVYSVAVKPNGSRHFRAVPVDVPLKGDEGYNDVEISYWQHESDERCDFDDSQLTQLASQTH